MEGQEGECSPAQSAAAADGDWRTDLMQMTRAFMLESRRMGIRLSAPDPS